MTYLATATILPQKLESTPTWPLGMEPCTEAATLTAEERLFTDPMVVTGHYRPATTQEDGTFSIVPMKLLPPTTLTSL